MQRLLKYIAAKTHVTDTAKKIKNVGQDFEQK